MLRRALHSPAHNGQKPRLSVRQPGLFHAGLNGSEHLSEISVLIIVLAVLCNHALFAVPLEVTGSAVVAAMEQQIVMGFL